MKVEIVKDNNPSKPSLYINNDNTIIILAINILNSSNMAGTVCYSKDDEYEIGFYDIDWDKNRWNKFSNGIHFFIDRNMAVVYGSNLLGIKDINLYLKQY